MFRYAENIIMRGVLNRKNKKDRLCHELTIH